MLHGLGTSQGMTNLANLDLKLQDFLQNKVNAMRHVGILTLKMAWPLWNDTSSPAAIGHLRQAAFGLDQMRAGFEGVGLVCWKGQKARRARTGLAKSVNYTFQLTHCAEPHQP